MSLEIKNRLFAILMSGVMTTGMIAALDIAGASRALAADAPAAATPNDTQRRGAQNGEQFRERMRARIEERRAAVDRHLTADQVRDIVAGRLALADNPNLKVGKVTAKEDGVVAVDIVTKTGALVTTREVSTKTGGPARRPRTESADAGGPGRAGPGMMDRGGRGGPQRGPGGMGRGGRDGGQFALGADGPRDLKLTTDQAKKLAEARLIELGNSHLKVGAVKEKDADTISVDIVAADNSLVVQREIDRHSGRTRNHRAPG